MAYLAAKDLRMTEKEDLYVKFYNAHKIAVKSLDYMELCEHITELERIALEAKAKAAAAVDDKRERKAKSAAPKEWLTTDKPYDVSTAINVVKERKSRMTKLDKIRQQLKDANFEDSVINEMIAGMEAEASKKTLMSMDFKKPAQKAQPVVNAAPTKFDPSELDRLFSKKKDGEAK